MTKRMKLSVVAAIVVVAVGATVASKSVRRGESQSAGAASQDRGSMVQPLRATATNAEILELTVLEIATVESPARRAQFLAQAAALCVKWDRPRAQELAKRAVEALDQARTLAPDSSLTGDPGSELESTLQEIMRFSALLTLTEVDPKLAVATAERLGETKEDLASVRLQAGLSARKTDPTWAAQQLRLVDDPDKVALAELDAIDAAFAEGQPPRDLAWEQFAPALAAARRLQEPKAHARYLALLGAMAEYLGHHKRWQEEIKPELLLVTSLERELPDRASLYEECIMLCKPIAPTAAEELAAQAIREVEGAEAPPEDKTLALLRVLQASNPREALREIGKTQDAQRRVTYLVELLRDYEATGVQESAASQLLALMEQRTAVAESPQQEGTWLRALARAEPDAALRIAERDGFTPEDQSHLRWKVLSGAAKTRPSWVIPRVGQLRSSEERVPVLLRALRTRVETPAS